MKKIILILFVVGILIQFFPIDKSLPATNKGMDFLNIKNTPESTAQLIKTACYDCHSNETVYPKYARVQPLGWFVQRHVDEGRKHLNFSTFSTYEPRVQAQKLDECADEIEQGEMPLGSYIVMHQEAKLTNEQKEELVTYFRKQAKKTRLMNTIIETITP